MMCARKVSLGWLKVGRVTLVWSLMFQCLFQCFCAHFTKLISDYCYLVHQVDSHQSLNVSNHTQTVYGRIWDTYDYAQKILYFV